MAEDPSEDFLRKFQWMPLVISPEDTQTIFPGYPQGISPGSLYRFSYKASLDCLEGSLRNHLGLPCDSPAGISLVISTEISSDSCKGFCWDFS